MRSRVKGSKNLIFILLAVLLAMPVWSSERASAHGPWPWVVSEVTASTKGDLLTLYVMLQNRNSDRAGISDLDVRVRVPEGTSYVSSWAGGPGQNPGKYDGIDVVWSHSNIKASSFDGPFAATFKVLSQEPVIDALAYVRWSKPRPGDSVSGLQVANPLESVETMGQPIAANMPALVHSGYVDVAANIGDLRTQMGNWEKGQDSGRRISLEKVERLEAVIRHTPWPTRDLAATSREIAEGLHPLEDSLKATDLEAAKEALPKVTGPFHDMTHAFYDKWLASMTGVTGDGMVHAAYADVAANVNDLRTQMANWEKGEDSGRRIGLEKVDRLGWVIEHVAWPTQKLAATAGELKEGLEGVEHGLKDQDVKEAKEALAEVSGAFHDMTHGFYDEWTAAKTWQTGHAMSHVAWVDVAANINDLRSQMGNWEKGEDSGRRIATEKVDRLDWLMSHVVWPREWANSAYEIARALPFIKMELNAKNLDLAKKHLAQVSGAFHDLTHEVYDSLEPATPMVFAEAEPSMSTPEAEAPQTSTAPAPATMPLAPMPEAMAPMPPAPAAPELDAGLVAQGKGLYSSKGCAACHGAVGEGGIGPKLAGHYHSAELISGVVRGGEGIMPAFAPGRISDSELQAIVAFVQSLAQ